jgi:hypothetical protein
LTQEGPETVQQMRQALHEHGMAVVYRQSPATGASSCRIASNVEMHVGVGSGKKVRREYMNGFFTRWAA